MIFSALLIIALPALDVFDEANFALTSCGFAVYRSAIEQKLEDEQFARKLSADCSQQITDLRRAIIAVEQARGKAGADATRSADSALDAFRASFHDQYARRAEDERNLRALQKAIKQEGETDAR